MVHKRETSDGERGVVTMRVEAFTLVDDGDDELVCSFTRTALSMKRPDDATDRSD